MWMYRALMLAWAFWMAWFLIRIGRYVFESWTAGGAWSKWSASRRRKRRCGRTAAAGAASGRIGTRAGGRMTIDAWLRAAAARLNTESARLDAELLLTHVLGHDARRVVCAAARRTRCRTARAKVDALLARRMRGEPIAYITGVREFWFLPLKITPAVLVPRPETEVLVEQALLRLPEDRDLALLDLGTGSGAIALALAKERPRAIVHAVDASDAALAVAEENAKRLGLSNLRFVLGDWFWRDSGRMGTLARIRPALRPGRLESALRRRQRSASAARRPALRTAHGPDARRRRPLRDPRHQPPTPAPASSPAAG
jgi:hypothetical protein